MGTPQSQKNITTIVENTCAFDSIAHIMSCMYSDYDSVKQFVGKNISLEMFQFITKMADPLNTSTVIYKERDIILKGLRPAKKKTTNGMTVYDCTTSLENIINKLLPPTILTVASCVCYKEDMPKGYLYVPILLNKLKALGVKQIERCVDIDFINKKSCGTCNLSRTIHFNEYVIMDIKLDNNPKVSTSAFKAQIEMAGISFNLYGVVEFIPSTKNSHFVAHVLRKNNKWETYDDGKSIIGRPGLQEFSFHI